MKDGALAEKIRSSAAMDICTHTPAWACLPHSPILKSDWKKPVRSETYAHKRVKPVSMRPRRPDRIIILFTSGVSGTALACCLSYAIGSMVRSLKSARRMMYN